MRKAPAAIAVAAALLAPPAAEAATTTVGFDDLVPGTKVTTQYLNAGGASQGLEFGRFNGKTEGVAPQVEQVPAGQANSGSQVGDIYEAGGEFSETQTWATFPFQKNLVRVFVGLESPGSTPVTLTAFGNNAQPLGNSGATQTKTVTSGTGYKTMLEVTGPSALNPAIKFIRVAPPTPIGGGTPVLKIDDVSFDTPDPGAPPPPPDFGLSWTSPLPNVPLGLSKGKSVSTPITINRSNGSNGDIAFSVVPSTLPSGVSASFAPNPVGGTGSSTTLKLTASQNAATVGSTSIKVVGDPTTSAGTVNRFVDIPVTVRLSDFDMLLAGIEVTQGIQQHEDHRSYYRETGSVDIGSQVVKAYGQDPGSCGKAIPSLPQRDMTDLTKPVDYSQTELPPFGGFIRTGGVFLAQDKKTFVRVYGNLTSPVNGEVENVPALLYGRRGGKSLPGSPLSPDNGALTLRHTGRTFVNCRDRADPNGPYLFTLPDAWTHGDVELRARLVPPDVLFGAGGECGTSQCAANNSLRLSGVDFTRTSYLTVTPVEMVHGGFGGADVEVRPPRPGVVFRDARRMVPSRVLFGEGADDFSYAGVISITDAESDMQQELKDAESDAERKEIRADACSDILGQLEDWADEHPHGDLTVGVYRNVCAGVTDGGYSLIPDAEAFMVVESTGPRTSVLHEMTHGIGRPHASRACGGGTDGQVGESWPLDQEGHIHGVGFDPDTLTPLVPKGILGIDSLGATQEDEYHDFMSYCFSTDSATWNSDRGWNDSLFSLYTFQKRRGRTSSAAVPFAGSFRAAGGLRVIAVTDGATAEILRVKPATGRAARPGTGSPYQLVARDAAGNVRAAAAMRAIQSHVDGGGLRTMLRADVPSSGVASVEIVRDGRVLARRARSARAPSVRVLAPRSRSVVGRRRTVAVRWTAADADGDRLSAKVDYSTDGGRSYETIFTGANTGRVDLPSTLITGSRRARVRVRVSDGFNESSARSRAFTAVAHGPRPVILSPRRNARISADARLYLEGSAYDEAGRRLQGRRLRWFLGRRRLGSGERLSVSGLRAGRRRIRLVARDRRGRRGTTSVLVRVIGAAPQFLRLDAPARLGTRATRVRLAVASTRPATLRVGGRRFRVSRRARRIVLRIRPGGSALSLRLALGAGSRTTRVRLVVPRA